MQVSGVSTTGRASCLVARPLNFIVRAESRVFWLSWYNWRMDFDTLEKQALGLPVRDRARLVQDLLESLDRLTPTEVQSLWLDEAERRANQIDRGEVSLVSVESVAPEARAILR